MSDAKRIFEDGSPFERSLLASADDDESPPLDLESRILAALPPPPSIDAPAPKPSSPVAPLSPRRGVVALAAVGASAILAVLIAGRAADRPRPAPSVAPPSTAIEAPNEAPRSDAPPREEPAVTVVTPDALPSVPPAKLDPKAQPTPRTETSAELRGDPASSLAREVALLDTIKGKLGSGDVAGAARTLDGYDAEFPRGTLRPEATVLRIRTLLAQGKRADAEKLADEFLARHPGSVHSSRIRALLAD